MRIGSPSAVPRGAAMIASTLLIGGLAGCGETSSDAEVPLGRESTGSGGIGDPSEGFATLRESKRVVDQTMKSAARTLVTDGLTVQNAIGGATACASAPTEAAEYTAYARLVGGSGQLESRLREAADRLVAAGWKIEERRGAPDPAYRLSEGPEAALGIGPDVQPGGSAITFSVKGPCLRIEGPGLGEFADEELDLDPCRAALPTAATVLALGLAGCSAEELPPPASFSSGEPVGAEEDGIASLRTSIKAVDATMRDAARALETGGEMAGDGLRTVEACEFGAFPGTVEISFE